MKTLQDVKGFFDQDIMYTGDNAYFGNLENQKKYWKIIEKYIKIDIHQIPYIRVVDFLSFTENDLNLIKEQHSQYLIDKFINALKTPYYKKILPEFLQKNPDWLEYFI